jgi:diguanylate cyclase (GGDEF)-like protein
MYRRGAIERKIQDDLARRSLQGVWGQPWITLLAFATTDFRVRAPLLMWCACAFMAVTTILRLVLLKRMDSLYPLNPRRWKLLHVAVVMFCAAFWGFMAAFAVRIYGHHNENALIFILCHAGVSLGMVILLVHDSRLMRLGQALLYGPLLFSMLFLDGDRRWGLTLTVMTYLVYVLLQGKKLHDSYWLQIEDNFDLQAMARHDSLTGLPNRLFMYELMDTAMTRARQEQRQIALMYIDLDGFKQVNDRFSHEIGDLLLREVAGRLESCIGSRGAVARLGGDEFTILLTDYTSLEEVAMLADRVLRSAQQPVYIEGFLLSYSASIGVSLFPDDAEATDHLVRAADLAMYVAKRSGKNQVCFFDAITEPATEFETYADTAVASSPALDSV